MKVLAFALFVPLLVVAGAGQANAQAVNGSGEIPANCSFTDMQSFFNYAHQNNLNITREVQGCQNLCILTFGVGNPDLSGIGV